MATPNIADFFGGGGFSGKSMYADMKAPKGENPLRFWQAQLSQGQKLASTEGHRLRQDTGRSLVTKAQTEINNILAGMYDGKGGKEKKGNEPQPSKIQQPPSERNPQPPKAPVTATKAGEASLPRPTSNRGKRGGALSVYSLPSQSLRTLRQAGLLNGG